MQYRGQPVVESAFQFVTEPHQCAYLADRSACLEYEVVRRMSPAEYSSRLVAGWRRFGHTLFRPRCVACSECRSLRVDVASFSPRRSQRRVRTRNESTVSLHISKPTLGAEKLGLYDRYHAHQHRAVGWSAQPPKDAAEYLSSFVRNPFATEEWQYRLGQQLIGIGYVDRLPVGLSAIYFFHEPACREMSPGTWNILCLIEEAARQRLSHVYLGYYVAGCRSLAYKADFRPCQVLGADGRWIPFEP